jgi:2-polyprenyl-3-methyl-5-hydroxy-6-metoxy-1,4-benzoquinol methylase
MQKLTEKSYWDETYRHRKKSSGRQFDAFLNYSNRMILEKLQDVGLAGKAVLEIGAGDSLWLPFLAKRFPSSRFAGVDYSAKGCALLSARALEDQVHVDVFNEDMFTDASALFGAFDVAISLGVVEHFDDLAAALAAKRRYLKPGGVMFTLIPNMAGLIGGLTRAWNRPVFDKHNPHDLPSFLQGHHEAELQVISAGYLGLSDFGVLASCFPDRSGFAWQCSRGLVAASVISWWVEAKIGTLPRSRVLSPYLFAISHQLP